MTIVIITMTLIHNLATSSPGKHKVTERLVKNATSSGVSKAR